MNRDEIMAMEAGTYLDVCVAQKVFGCEVFQHNIETENGKTNTWYDCGCEGGVHSDSLSILQRLKRYSADYNAIAEMEKEIAGNRETQERYMDKLDSTLDLYYGFKYHNDCNHLDYDDAWALITATPEQKCKAAILAVMEL